LSWKLFSSRPTLTSNTLCEPMKALLLCAGYGTRLDKDLREDTTGLYSHLIGVPKPLLPVGQKALISRWVEHLLRLQITDIIVVTNALFHDQFVKWSESWPEVRLICDGTFSNETRLGAVACIQLAVDAFAIQDDLLVIGGDTLFYEDFSVAKLVQVLKQRQADRDFGGVLIGCKCRDEETHKYGILEIDEENKVTSMLEKPSPDQTPSRLACPCCYLLTKRVLFAIGEFLEKPSPDQTPSRLACPCCYLLSKKVLFAIGEFLEFKKDEPLRERDAPGHLISYLQSRFTLYVVEVSGRFDVGGLHSLTRCQEYFETRGAQSNQVMDK